MGRPRSCRATDTCRRAREAVVGSVGRVSVAVVMISPMVGGLRRKSMVYLRRKERQGH